MISPYAQLDDFIEFCEQKFTRYKEAIAEESADMSKIKQSVIYSDSVFEMLEDLADMYKRHTCANIISDMLND